MTQQLFDVEEPIRRVSLVRLSGEVARSLAAVGRFAVEGEVHRPTRSGSGRTWFTLRDRAAQISVTCPAGRPNRFRTVNGERVLVTGTLTWTTDRGQVLLVAEEVVPVGAGAVAAAIAEARARLAADGLLDRPRRRIPRLPRVIGVVCGTEAAVRADIESVVAARFPGYPMEVRQATVSGPGAAEAVATALAALDARDDVDVIVLARGGGDATQLLPFSDEGLCRAICASTTPVVSAIGHDGDRPLTDDVADLRCGTPSLAAAAVVPSLAELEEELDRLVSAADAAVDRRVTAASTRIAAIDRDRAVDAGFTAAHHRLGRLAAQLEARHPRREVAAAGARLRASRDHLEALSPARVLERGYAVVRRHDGSVVRDATSVAPGERLAVQVAAGRLAVTADEVGP